MKAEGYPGDLAAAEQAAGYKKVNIEQIESWAKPGDFYEVIAYLAGPADLVIKHHEAHFGRAAYSHRRWGVKAGAPPGTKPAWHTLSGPHADPALAAGTAVMALLEEKAPTIVGEPFRLGN